MNESSNQRIKVLYSIPGLAINLDAPWVTRSRAGGMIAAGLDVTLMVRHEEDRAYFKDMPCEIIVECGAAGKQHSHHVARGTLVDFIAKPALTQWRAFRIARKIGADVLYFSHPEPWSLLPAVLWHGWRGFKPRVAFSVTHVYYRKEHSYMPFLSRVRSWMNMMGARRLVRLITVVYGDRFAPPFFGVAEGRPCAIIPEGYRTDLASLCDRTEARKRLGIPLERRVLLAFGAASITKGQHLLFEALRKMDPVCDVYVVGAADGVYIDPKSAGQDLLAGRWKEHLHFVSRYVSDAEMLDYFAAADAAVLPYMRGYVVTSGSFRFAVECGRPVLVADQYYLGAAVREHGLGLLFPPEDVPALRAAIQEFARKPAAWFEEIRENCARLTQAESWTETGRKYNVLFSASLNVRDMRK